MFSDGFPQDKQISYAGMLWLLGAQMVVMAPLMFFLPVWLLPILIFSAGWRIRVMKGYLAQPSLTIKIILAILGLLALSLSGMKLVSLDMMASLLMLGFSYKAIEVIQRRDAMVVILTGFILVGVLFLYSQSIFVALYGVLALVVLTGAFIAIQQSQSHAVLPNLRLSFVMLSLCLPLMLLFFIFSPRFAPLWSMPLSSGQQAKTGMTDTMTPGDIADLSQSDELAFTVKFLGDRPKQNDLYWRGLVLQYFDGKTWTQFENKVSDETIKYRLRSNQQRIRNRLVKKGSGLKYEVIYEKTGRSWMFALSPVIDIQGNALYGKDFRIMAEQNITEPTMVTLTSYPDALKDAFALEETQEIALQLPQHSNPQSRALAKRLYDASRSDEDYIQKVLNRYREGNYFYTLRPDTLGNKNTIDAFLFNSKKGFCAHYAGSFVFMMRAVGLPARVVVGYQGGAWNEEGKFLSVRQYDAHAWTEVWLEDKGWVRFDPTGVVAPERIEKSLEAAMKKEGSFLEGKLFSMRQYKWLSQLQNKFDATQYAWRRFVLGYDSDTQMHFLKGLFGDITIQKVSTIMGIFFIGLTLFWVLFLGLGKKSNQEALEHQLYQRFCRLLKKKGLVREPSQVPENFSQVAASQFPHVAPEINQFSALYSELCYNPDKQDQTTERLKNLRELLKKIAKGIK